MLPNFIGIGAPKSGTTWLFQCLQKHPEIFLASVKETHFFDFFFDENNISGYEENFRNSNYAKAIGEVTATYLASTQAPERIKKYMPDAKLIVNLRNPFDQVYSHYWHLLRQNFHESDCQRWSFEQAIERYEERLIKPAMYSKHLKKWLEYFDKSQIHLIFYEEIKQDPYRLLHDLYSFLEVSKDFMPESLLNQGTSVRQGVSPRNPLLSQAHSVIYQNLNEYVYAPLKKAVGVRRSSTLKDSLKVRQIMQFFFYRSGYPKMNSGTRSILKRHFSQDIQELEILTGRSLSHWC